MCLLSDQKNGTFGSPQKVLHPFFTAVAKNERKIAEDILNSRRPFDHIHASLSQDHEIQTAENV